MRRTKNYYGHTGFPVLGRLAVGKKISLEGNAAGIAPGGKATLLAADNPYDRFLNRNNVKLTPAEPDGSRIVSGQRQSPGYLWAARGTAVGRTKSGPGRTSFE